jgi:hypothetical protein
MIREGTAIDKYYRQITNPSVIEKVTYTPNARRPACTLRNTFRDRRIHAHTPTIANDPTRRSATIDHQKGQSQWLLFNRKDLRF